MWVTGRSSGIDVDHPSLIIERSGDGVHSSPGPVDDGDAQLPAQVLARKFRWSATRMREARAAIGDFTVLVHPRQPVSVVREDEADNRILECALAAGADAIVTGDHHLLELRRFGGVRITTPREFLDAESRR